MSNSPDRARALPESRSGIAAGFKDMKSTGSVRDEGEGLDSCWLDITFNENPDAWWGKIAKTNANKDVAGLMLAVEHSVPQ